MSNSASPKLLLTLLFAALVALGQFSPTGGPAVAQPAQAERKMSLYERLGGERGLTVIVDDFMLRAIYDPRVNWPRKEVQDPTAAWMPNAESIANLKRRFVRFLASATGGPATYEGKGMKSSYAGMRISNAEFDAVVGDLKATLDKLQVPNKEQRELLAIFESTRREVVTDR